MGDRAAAKRKHSTAELLITDHGRVRSGGPTGYWVQAEVFVYNEEVDNE